MNNIINQEIEKLKNHLNTVSNCYLSHKIDLEKINLLKILKLKYDRTN